MTSTASTVKLAKASATGLTGITVCGFKSLVEEAHIDLRRLTILAGANSSGKSSIVQPLLMLKQTLDAPYDPGPLRISGPNVQFTEVDQFLPRIPGTKCPKDLTVKLGVDRSESVAFRFSPDARKGMDLKSMTYETDKEKWVLKPQMTKAEIEKTLPEYATMTVESLSRGKKTE